MEKITKLLFKLKAVFVTWYGGGPFWPVWIEEKGENVFAIQRG